MPVHKETGRAFPLPSAHPFKQQATVVPGTEKPGQTGHYRNALLGLLDADDPKYLNTLDDAFTTALGLGADRRCLGFRPKSSSDPLKFANHYEWQSYGEVDVRRRAIGSALQKMFQSGELGGTEPLHTVGIWSVNRPEWMIVELALQSYNKVNVTLYETLGAECVEYIINHAHLSVIFSSLDCISKLLDGAAGYPGVKLIVCIDGLPDESEKSLSARANAHGIRIMDLNSFEEIGRANPIDPIPATPSQVATICYTSGSTGMPKGAVLTHQMLAMAVQSNLFGVPIGQDSRLLSYLPLAHIFERVAEHAIIALGGSIGYFTGDPKRLAEDAQVLKPNFFPTVPRVMNRVYQAVMAASKASGLKGVLVRMALSAKLQRLHSTGNVKHAFWDRVVFKKIQALLGGQLRLIVCGSAPISKDAMDVLKVVFACNFEEGYGMTENAATCTRCWTGDTSSSGTVGPPQCVVEIKLIDVPSMNYTAEDKPHPRGELCVRGLTCITEYYKDEANTKATVDEEGWIHTGDVAAVDECGRFVIIDRVKNIMKLAQGEYVALEKIENTYSACPIASQIYVHGNSLESYLLGVVVMEPTELANVASRVLGSKVSDEDKEGLQTIVRDPKVVDEVLHTLNQEAKSKGLKGFEMMRRIHLTIDPFKIEDGTLTPTFKIVRKNAYQKFKTELDGLYALSEPSKEGRASNGKS